MDPAAAIATLHAHRPDPGAMAVAHGGGADFIPSASHQLPAGMRGGHGPVAAGMRGRQMVRVALPPLGAAVAAGCLPRR
jgi:hypothetical protein